LIRRDVLNDAPEPLYKVMYLPYALALFTVALYTRHAAGQVHASHAAVIEWNTRTVLYFITDTGDFIIVLTD